MPTHELGLRRRYVGEPVPRVEDPRLLTGRGRFVDDLQPPGTLHVAFLRSPHAHAEIGDVDSTRALAHPGVVAVVSGPQLAEHAQPLVTALAVSALAPLGRYSLAVDKVRFVGEPVAAIVAVSRYAAEDALELVEVDWRPLPPVMDPIRGMEPGSALLHEELPANVIAHLEHRHGDVDGALAGAAHVFSKRVIGNRVSPCSLETRGVLALYDAYDGELTVHSSTQIPHGLRGALAGSLGMRESAIRVLAPDVGGAFGGKLAVAAEEIAVPALARMLERPVKWTEDRAEHLATCVHAKDLVIELDVGVDPDGRILAIKAGIVGDSGAYSIYPFSALSDPSTAAAVTPSLYDVQDVSWTIDAVMTNKSPGGAYRGVGRTNLLMALEGLLDDVARQLELDPVELRLRNVIPDAPYTSATGAHYDGGSYADSIRRACELVDYSTLRERQRRLREEGRYIGFGMCPYVENTGFGTAMTKVVGFPLETYDAVEVTMELDGSVVVRTPFHSDGQSHETTFAQVAADCLGVSIDSVRIVQGDTASTPRGMGTYASRSMVVAAGAISRAAGEVRERLLKIAAESLEADPHDLTIHDGVIAVAGSPDATLPVGNAALIAYHGEGLRPAEVEQGLSATRTYDPPETYGNGTAAAVVEVDVETGVVSIEALAVADDCGTVINPMVVEGQVVGAAAQGIGICLYEEILYDDDGQLLTGSLMDYALPSTMEVPNVQLTHIESTGATIGDVKGVGEAGTQSVPAAVAAAVADALAPFGAVVDRTPLRPTTVLDLLDGAGRQSLRVRRGDAGA